MTTTTEPTLLEELHALEVTAHRLATERDAALKKSANFEKQLKRAQHHVVVVDAVNQAQAREIEDLKTELRRSTALAAGLATQCSEKQELIDRLQQRPEPAPRQKQRRFRRAKKPQQMPHLMATDSQETQHMNPLATVIPFRRNAIATRDRIASILDGQRYRIYGTWDDRGEEAVHVTHAGWPVGSGVYVADGQQLVVGDDGTLRVEEIGRA